MNGIQNILGYMIIKGNEKVFNKNRVIRLPQIVQKQLADLRCNVLTSLVHFVTLEVSNLILSFMW